MNSKNIYLVFTLIFINSLIINGQITKRPVFTKATYESLTISKANLNCKPENVVLTANATSYCKVSKTLNFAYQIDYGNNGSFEVSGTGNSAIMGNNAAYSFGSHKIKWIVTDACGGISTCTKLVTINNPTDTIKPTAIAKPTAIELESNTCTATLEASKVNNNSYDNCTKNANLRYRLINLGEFNPNMKLDDILKFEDKLLYGVVSLGVNTYYLIVIDENNNWNYTEGYVVVQNNLSPDICIVGCFPTKFCFVNYNNGQKFYDTSVVFSIYRDNYLQNNKKINSNGFFDLGYQSQLQYIKYSNTIGYKDLSNNNITFLEDYLNNKATFSNPYARLAADINQDHVIDAKDLELMRKVIVLDSFNYFTKYIFLPNDYIFKNAEPEKDILPVSFTVEKNEYKYYLKAIKLGDIYNNLLHQPTDRSNDEFVETQLFQNQPNPFTTNTTIPFILYSAQLVEFSFYDLNGRLLKSIKRNFEAGQQQLTIDANELNSNGLIYFQMITKEKTFTQNMLLIKN